MPGRVTRRGIARWAGHGGRERTIHGVFTTNLSWGTRPWVRIRHHLVDHDAVRWAGGDEGVVTTSGTKTDGVERCVSSLDGKTVPGRGGLRVALMRVTRRSASPVMREPLATPRTDNPQKSCKTASSGHRGRPQGRQERHRRDVRRAPSGGFVQEPSTPVLKLSGDPVQVLDFVDEGACGHHEAWPMVRQPG